MIAASRVREMNVFRVVPQTRSSAYGNLSVHSDRAAFHRCSINVDLVIVAAR